VTVEGARLAKPDDDVLARLGIDLDALPEPPLPATGSPDYNVLVTGIGGSGVVTIGALISMAAHLEGRYATVLDQTGLAQKNGAVVSHVRVTGLEAPPCTPRIPERHADLLLACDQLVAAADGYLPTYDRERTHVLLNTETAPTSDWVNDPDTVFPEETVRRRLRACVDPQRILELPVTAWATALLGDAIGTNLFLVGVALQRGLLPVSPGALERAIELNGVAVTMNRRALALGRFAALDPEAFARRVAEVMPVREEPPGTLDALVADRAERLVAYQGAALAERYRNRVGAVRELERRVAPHEERLTRAVAEQYFRLLAVKDEYEVARLYASPAFRERLGREFSDWKRLRVQLAPPLLSRPDPVTGEPRKRAFGLWIFPAFGLLARLRGLRGTAWDPFGRTEERRTERRLAAEYEAWLDGLGDDLGPSLHETACALAELPARVRGFGPVKLRNVRAYDAERARLQEHYAHLARHGERIFRAA
jgi:indolepyruvate ferredoxin oxidoreductase